MFKMMIVTVFKGKKQVTGSWSMCSKNCKKLGKIFQHWENPGFIQNWEQHVQDADLEEKHKLQALGQCAQKIVKN